MILSAFAAAALITAGVAVTGYAVRGWRRAGRPAGALAEVPPSPAEVAELVDVLDTADSRRPGGADLFELAVAVLAADYRKQRGEGR